MELMWEAKRQTRKLLDVRALYRNWQKVYENKVC